MAVPAPQYLQKGNVRLRAVETPDERGATVLQAATTLGSRIAPLNLVHLFFTDLSLRRENRNVLDSINPIRVNTPYTDESRIITNPLILSVRLPLAETIQSDGHGRHYISDTSDEGVAWRIMVEPKLLKKRLEAQGLKITNKNILIASDTYTVWQDGPARYTTMLPSDLNGLRVGRLPAEGTHVSGPMLGGAAIWHEPNLLITDNFPVLFGNASTQSKTYIWFSEKDVSISLPSTGNHVYASERKGGIIRYADIQILNWSDYGHVLVPDPEFNKHENGVPDVAPSSKRSAPTAAAK
nr:hypothetical protein [Candidatus Burarchaeum sp.]